MFCTKCGEKLEEGSKFCVKCGTPVNTQSVPNTLSTTGTFGGVTSEQMKTNTAPKWRLNSLQILTIIIAISSIICFVVSFAIDLPDDYNMDGDPVYLPLVLLGFICTLLFGYMKIFCIITIKKAIKRSKKALIMGIVNKRYIQRFSKRY